MDEGFSGQEWVVKMVNSRSVLQKFLMMFSLVISTEPCLTMTRARTVGCQVKDLVLNMEIFSMLSTPLMMSGGKPGESRWRGTVRRWGSSPANGGKNAFSISKCLLFSYLGGGNREDEDMANCYKITI